MVFGLVAAACGDDSGGGTDEGTSPSGETDTPPEIEGDPAPGGSVNYALEAETNGGFCLAEAQLAISGIQVARSIYDTLTAPNAEGEITPFLAESFSSNEDATEWTFVLREGIKFHDGTDLTAEVVKNNLDAYRGEYRDANGDLIREPLLFAFVLQDVDSVEVIDPLTVKVNMVRPWVSFPWTVWGSARFGIMAQSQLDSDTCGDDMVGTGPFALEEWVVGEQMTLTKNADYWQTDANGIQLPYLDELIYRPIPDGTQRVSALETDEVTMIHTSSTQQMVERLQPLADSGDINLYQTDSFGEVNYFMLNVTKPPFDNKNARIAVAAGVDRELLDEVRGGGIATIADGPFQADVVGSLDDTGFPQFDPEASMAAAAAYEEETGQPLEFTYSTTAVEENTLTAQEIQGQLAEVGITMNIRSSADQATLINEAIAKDFDALGWRNHPGADPDTQYNWWYEGSLVNFGGIADPEINRLLDEGRTTIDQAERVAIYEDLNRRFGEEVFNVWTTFTIWAIATAPDVGGILGPPLPDGTEPFPGLATGAPVSGLFVNTTPAGG
jgi:peptide/nickel transport system substrate-binding protein